MFSLQAVMAACVPIEPLARLQVYMPVTYLLVQLLQIDLQGNSSTATVDRISGFGGAPNMGSDPHGRRHASYAYTKAGREAVDGKMIKGRKLVVQMVETYREHMHPVFVEELDAWQLQEKNGERTPANHDLWRRRNPYCDRRRHCQLTVMSHT